MFVLSVLYACSLIKYICILPKLVRLFERITSYGNCRMLLSVFNFAKVQTRFHGCHPEFNYLQFQQGIQECNPRKFISDDEQTIILSNEGSLADFIYLSMTFSPLFVSVDFLDSSKEKMGLRPLSGWQLIKRAIGVTLP